ncbi:response regulator [Roseibacillus ishigakijimensis]|uniref:Response regulator transcription factor n=1 Tax=Roseibacillus ishigakijimensis TaxID=454146 RepID=A0A934RN46_9BACT|nr:response regulator transcription factor [Roseibacillus ishigakijimensis]MBK1834449.1 response regulator transcription factor [Roseibacillus ishigakijimensis]
MTTTRRLRILLVDDHIIVRIGTIEAIASEPTMEVVGELSGGENIVERYGDLRPDVVLMDYRLTGRDGVASTRDLLAAFPGARVLFLSVYDGEDDIGRALQAGAKGYLSKNAETEELLDAISTVARGECYLPTELRNKLQRQQQRRPLTEREHEVLVLLVEGLSNKEIGDRLSLSLATVKLHISNLLAKLDVEDRTQAAVTAVRRGLIHLDD